MKIHPSNTEKWKIAKLINNNLTEKFVPIGAKLTITRKNGDVYAQLLNKENKSILRNGPIKIAQFNS